MQVVTGGMIHALGPSPAPEAIAWDRGRIVAAGARSDVLGAAGPGAQVRDLEGRALVPGFVDPHHHLSYALLLGGAVDCSPANAPTASALLARLGRQSESVARGEWIVAYGYDELRMDRRITRRDLDDACPQHPVVIIHYSCHEAVASSRALEAAGIGARTASPFGGAIERDARGAPTGRLIETAMAGCEKLARAALIDRHDAEALRERVRRHEAQLFAAGIVRIADACVPSDLLALYRRLIADGALRVPVIAMPFAPGAQIFSADDWLDQGATGEGTDALRIGPAKWVLDGVESCAVCLSIGEFVSAATRTLSAVARTRSFDPLRQMQRATVRLGRDGKMHSGDLLVPRERLQTMAQAATSRGLTLAMHALGNESMALALDVIEAVGPRRDNPPPRIEHAMLSTRALARRAGDLGVALVMQPVFLGPLSRPAPLSLPDSIRIVAMRTALDEGAIVAGSSDYPVDSMDPIVALRCAVSRASPGGPAIQPDEAITPAEWLRSYTIDAARVCGCADECGSIEVGKRADLVVLSHDPLAGGADLDELHVVETILAGETVFRRV